MKQATVVGIAVLGIIASIVIFECCRNDKPFDPIGSLPHAASSEPGNFRNKRFIYLHREQQGFEVIAENNLFGPLGWKKEVRLPEESAPKGIPEPMVSAPPPRPTTYKLILTGIAKHGGEWIAVIENRKEDDAAFLRRGDILKDALVQEIISEHITLVRGEATVQLALGESIEYGADGRLRLDAASTAKTPKASNRTYATPERKSNSGYDGDNNRFRRMPNRSKKDRNQ